MKENFGFTFFELLIVIGVLAILTVMAFPAFQLFRGESDLNETAEESINSLRLAQNKTLASEGASNYGVHFESDKFVLFKGVNYDSLAPDNDVHNLRKPLEIYAINLAGGGSKIVFDRVVGTTAQFGSVSLRLKADTSKTRTIYIKNSGQIGLTSPSIPSDEDRIKDSRHVHFDYSRVIATSTEKLTLTLDSSVTEEIIIADNLEDGQIYWEGEVDVGGSTQKLTIQTHILNDPVEGSQFSIHRDRRYNNKILDIDISGDSGITPNLINYSADGLTTSKGTSIYVTEEPDWQ